MKLIIILALAVATTNSASLDFIVKPGFPEGRIINGKDAVKGEAPFIVSLKDNSHFCGGSIIDEHWVLTAGHCLTQSRFEVVAGLHTRDDESDVQIRQIHSKAYQFVHANYSGGVGPNDIGLIYLTEPFDLNVLSRDGFAPVAKINLPSGKFEKNHKGKLYGWGRDNTGAVAMTLQTLDTNIIGYTKCKAKLPDSAPLVRTNICSYNTGTTDGACNGDSGGPLIRNTPDGDELVGIVSWGYIPCITSKYPSVYTMTSAFREWVENIINNFNGSSIQLSD